MDEMCNIAVFWDNVILCIDLLNTSASGYDAWFAIFFNSRVDISSGPTALSSLSSSIFFGRSQLSSSSFLALVVKFRSHQRLLIVTGLKIFL